MVSKYVIDVSIIWLNDNIYSRNTWFPATDVQTQNIDKLRYANRRAPTECPHPEQRRRQNNNVGATSAADREDADQCRRWANVPMLAG